MAKAIKAIAKRNPRRMAAANAIFCRGGLFGAQAAGNGEELEVEDVFISGGLR
jgi:hypothetical protein